MQIAFDVDEATDIDATYANVNERAFAIAKAASQPPGTVVCPATIASAAHALDETHHYKPLTLERADFQAARGR